MELTTAILVTIIALVLSALFSGSEIAFVQSSKVRMEIDAARGGIVDRIIRGFARHEEMFISTLLVGNNIVLVIYGITFSIIINPLLIKWFDNNEALVLIVNTILSTSVVLIAGEFMPKTAFRINPNFMIRLFALPLFIIYWVLYPVSLLVSGISRGLMRLFGITSQEGQTERLTIDELDDYLQHLDDNPRSEPVENEVKIFRNAIDFKDTSIGECMIPRNEIVAVGIDSVSREELIRKFIATGLSKIIVYGEDIDDVLGYIHVSELFNVEADWREKLKPVIFSPETLLANKMMRRMKGEKKSVAIIVDEFGGTAGLATLEDLVEEIFGEIEDEHDRKRLLAREVSPGEYEFSGRAEIESINEEFDLDIKESEEYHTLGGYILDRRGALPQQGDSFTIDDLNFTIIRMAANRIVLVKVSKN